MNELYLKLIVCGAIFFVAYLSNFLSAAVITGYAAWKLRDVNLGENQAIKKAVALLPQEVRKFLETK